METCDTRHLTVTETKWIEKERAGRVRAFVLVDQYPAGFYDGKMADRVPVYRRLLVEAVAGSQWGNVRARWDRKAGCSCGCSPGFVFEGSAGAPADLYIHVGFAAGSAEALAFDAAARARAADAQALEAVACMAAAGWIEAPEIPGKG